MRSDSGASHGGADAASPLPASLDQQLREGLKLFQSILDAPLEAAASVFEGGTEVRTSSPQVILLLAVTIVGTQAESLRWFMVPSEAAALIADIKSSNRGIQSLPLDWVPDIGPLSPSSALKPAALGVERDRSDCSDHVQCNGAVLSPCVMGDGGAGRNDLPPEMLGHAVHTAQADAEHTLHSLADGVEESAVVATAAPERNGVRVDEGIQADAQTADTIRSESRKYPLRISSK